MSEMKQPSCGTQEQATALLGWLEENREMPGVALPALQTELVIAGAVMPLVPGLAMTNAVQDTMRGDMVSGISHGVQAILTAFLIAGGALLAVEIMHLLTGGAA